LRLGNEWDWWVGSAVPQTTDDAYLHADLTSLSAKVPGYVRRVNVASRRPSGPQIVCTAWSTIGSIRRI
jgi:hypothetical protein